MRIKCLTQEHNVVPLVRRECETSGQGLFMTDCSLMDQIDF